MDCTAARAAEPAQIHGLGPAGKVSKDKTVPPECGPATRTAGRLNPGKMTAKAGNILDGYGNKKYQ
jgi:hypothetical protein